MKSTSGRYENGRKSSLRALGGTDEGKRVYVTLGQFSIVRLERETQLVIPVYDYSMPDKECACGEEGDPCDLFRRIRFPLDEFFPPDTLPGVEDYKSAL